MASSMARELLPEELRAAARWAVSALRAWLGWGIGGERRTRVVRSSGGGDDGSAAGHEESLLFDAARQFLASQLGPRAMRRLGLTLTRTKDAGGGAGWRSRLFVEPGDSTVDVFDGVVYVRLYAKRERVARRASRTRTEKGSGRGAGSAARSRTRGRV